MMAYLDFPSVTLRRKDGVWQATDDETLEPWVSVLPHAALSAWNSLPNPITYMHKAALNWCLIPDCFDARRA